MTVSHTYKVSIILPTYNGRKYIDKCLESIFNQTIGFENIELIVIDDNSTDKTFQYIEKISENYENFKCIENNCNHGTCGYSRNKGIDEASGEYITFVDQDDTLEPDGIEILYNEISRLTEEGKECNMLIANCNIIEDGVKHGIIDGSIYSEEVQLDEVWENNYPLLFDMPFITVWANIYNTKFIQNSKITFSNYTAEEDIYFNFQIYGIEDKIYFLNDAVYNYFLHGGALHTSVTIDNVNNQLKGYLKLHKLISSFGYDDIALQYFGSSIFHLIIAIFDDDNCNLFEILHILELIHKTIIGFDLHYDNKYISYFLSQIQLCNYHTCISMIIKKREENGR